MANENEFDLDSQNQVRGIDEIDFSDADSAREAYQELLDNSQKVFDSNKQLYARTKKAEGFELKEGKWVKLEKPKENPEIEPKKPSKEFTKPNEFELDYGKKAYLKAYGIQGADELELVKAEAKRSGLELDELVSNEYFTGKLQSLRNARESAAAVPKGKPRSGQTGVTDVDLAVAKYKESGELPQDFNTRNKVIDSITKSESAPLFSGPSVIGPQQ